MASHIDDGSTYDAVRPPGGYGGDIIQTTADAIRNGDQVARGNLIKEWLRRISWARRLLHIVLTMTRGYGGDIMAGGVR